MNNHILNEKRKTKQKKQSKSMLMSSQDLKEPRNYNRKLILSPPQKQAEIIPTFLIAIFENKFTLWHIRLNNICMCI